MLDGLFPFDIFSFINGIIILVFIIAIVFFIIVILIVYKLLHTNVDNVKKRSKKAPKVPAESVDLPQKELKKDNSISVNNITKCKYCGQEVEENTVFCQYCGSDLTL
ncbi:MAG: zinc ribbon domain-containing protein [Candidatus Lokiarchaeota archaeon]|nr:zinc ribbon domain-containing protein [Candidatus Lokiarchaeota archaeon]